MQYSNLYTKAVMAIGFYAMVMVTFSLTLMAISGGNI
jgi:hypothetical protein